MVSWTCTGLIVHFIFVRREQKRVPDTYIWHLYIPHIALTPTSPPPPLCSRVKTLGSWRWIPSANLSALHYFYQILKVWIWLLLQVWNGNFFSFDCRWKFDKQYSQYWWSTAICAQGPYVTDTGWASCIHLSIIYNSVVVERLCCYWLYIFYRRRYFPFELVKNILDGMSFVKLNVLHLHILDWCRFSVQSKLWVFKVQSKLS